MPGSMPSSVGEVGGVDQVAVVAEGDLVAAGPAGDGLGVLPDARPGGGVAGVADGEVAGQPVEHPVVEHRRDETGVLDGDQLGAVGHRHAGGLLAAVLQGEQPEIGQVGDGLAGGVDAEDAARLLELVVDGRRPDDWVAVEQAVGAAIASGCSGAGGVVGMGATGPSASRYRHPALAPNPERRPSLGQPAGDRVGDDLELLVAEDLALGPELDAAAQGLQLLAQRLDELVGHAAADRISSRSRSMVSGSTVA